MDQLQDIINGFIDLEGQRLSEALLTNLLIISGVLAFVVGYILQNIFYTLYVGLGGTALTFLIVVPPWPWYNKHPLQWLPAGITGEGEDELKKTK